MIYMKHCSFGVKQQSLSLVVHIVDIDGIVDHHFLNFLFIILLYTMNYFVQQQMSILRNYIDILRNTYYGFVIRLTRQVSLVEQELPTLPKHLSLPPVFSEVRVTRSLVLYI
jgi:hypothetical protein